MAPPKEKKTFGEQAASSSKASTGDAASKVVKKSPTNRSAVEAKKPANIADDLTGWAKKKKLQTCKHVDERLAELVPKAKVGEVSFCLKAPILKGFIDLSVENPLDQKIFVGTCSDDKTMGVITVRLRDVLYQPDSADTTEGHIVYHNPFHGPEAVLFMTNMCTGKPYLQVGAKFHKHCRDCGSFGKCMGDYRMFHCSTCGKHQWSECDNCNRELRRRRWGEDDEDDEDGDDY